MSTATSNQNSCTAARMESTPTPFELLAYSASQRPHHTALEYLSDDLNAPSLKITYVELFRDVQAVAHALSVMGLENDESVAILLPFVPEAVIAIIAASAVGTAFPLNLLLSADAIRSQLVLARCRVVVTLGPHPVLDMRERLNQALEGLTDAPAVVEVPVAATSSGAITWSDFTAVEPIFLPKGSPDRVGVLIHTGGTTGNPKLAQLSLRNVAVASLMAAEGLGVQASERLLTGLPLFHVGGAIDGLLAFLAVGATVVFPTALGMRNRVVVERIWQLVEQHEITLIGSVPTIIAAVVESPVGNSKLGSLRAVLTGGASLPRDLSLRFQEKIGKPICQLYGMTESSGIATAQLTDGSPVAHAAGKPVPGVHISLGEPGAQYQPGAKGEIFVRGPNIFQGYLTADGVIGNPNGEWFSSGDIGEVAENGELKVVGRFKDVIIRSGHNIDPQLIEEVALAHPAVAQAAAVAMPDDYAGEVPVLFATLGAGESVSPEELSSYIANNIAEPPARPKQVFILGELPLTAFAKVARFRLRQLAVEHRVRLLVNDWVRGGTVVCNDPAAKRVVVAGGDSIPTDTLEEIRRLLSRFGLELET